MGERLLCKQEVVGSIPSASRARASGRVLRGFAASREGLGLDVRVLGLPRGGAWRLGIRGARACRRVRVRACVLCGL